MCTGIILKAQDGAVIKGRSMEWGTMDIFSRIFIAPREKKITGTLPDGNTGFTWNAKYGFVGIDAFGQYFASDGMNEKGLVAGLFYHTGTAKYEKYDPTLAEKSMAATDLGTYILSMFATIDEIKNGIEGIHLVGIPLPGTNIEVPCHYMVADRSGKAITIEFLNGQTTIFDNPVGIITNSPSFDWHMTNLRNYLNFRADGEEKANYMGVEMIPIGHGAGLVGMPGDYTPPSRFVRAAALTNTARPTVDAYDTVLEMNRIMDSFNVPLERVFTPKEKDMQKGLVSSTTWTTISDTKNLRYYYHTQYNRRLRCLDLSKVDLSPNKDYKSQPLDRIKQQDIENITFST
jgi:choloylglycine hydrolase